MPVPREVALRRLLAPLTRATLLRLASEFGLPASKKADLISALVSEATVEQAGVLLLLSEGELRRVCKKLGLKADGGKTQLRWRLRQALRWLPFQEARELLRWIGLRGTADYQAWCKREARPPGVPVNPQDVYRDTGWEGWGDFLGTGRARRNLQVVPFTEARERARALGLRGCREWREHSQRARPTDLPSHPEDVYRDDGWAGWGDFLGTGNSANVERTFRPFADARAFVRRLGLASSAEWAAYSAGRDPHRGPRPDDIPGHPYEVYRDHGWQGWRDWLGTAFLPFKEARAFARSLGFEFKREWLAWCRGERPDLLPRPAKVPANPANVYPEQGWQGWRDWLRAPSA